MIKNKKEKRLIKIRKKIKSVNLGKLRISINRSKKNISAQIIDDLSNKTLAMASSLDKSITSEENKGKDKKLIAVAELLAKRASEKKLKNFYFDRGIYRYHGRIKLFADTLRKNGVKI